ncbi:response regulator transcription factor [Paenibacillus gansuensis]|uniref:Response regulator n=1 Tax=Paenibacillus gansuensis TaxID=306542 RepID=A0ABW5PB13_9BACL
MRTLTCLIVDDEPLILQRLEQLFGKLEFTMQGYKLIGSASSGQEALELAAAAKPDVVITDIVMPVMSGMELIEAMKPMLPHSFFVILSAYKDFEYAKQAIALDVTEYVVKVPLDDKALLEALGKAKERIMLKEESASRLNRMQQSIREHALRLRKQLVAELIAGTSSADRIMDHNKGPLQIDFEPRNYCGFHLKIDRFRDFLSKYSSTDRQHLKYALLNIAEETLHKYGKGFMCELEENRLAGFISWEGVKSESRVEEQCYEFGTELTRNAYGYLRLRVSVGFSKPRQGWRTAGVCLSEAGLSLKDAFYQPGTVITPVRRLVYDDGALDKLRALLDSCMEYLLAGSGGDEDISPVLGLLSAKSAEPVRAAETLQAWMFELKRKSLFPLTEQPDWTPDGMPLLLTREELEDELRSIWLGALKKKTELDSEHRERPEIRKAKQYIKTRLAEKITLSEVADFVGMNMTYFSETFKKEGNESFTDYVNRIRIEKAVTLIGSGRYSNQELSAAVGIPNERYFCTLFKKYTGTTPQKFGNRETRRG